MSQFSALADLRAQLAEHQTALADELMDGVHRRINPDALTTLAITEECERWLAERIAALNGEREDEKGFDLDKRDHDWLGASRAVLKEASHALHMVRIRLGELQKAEHRRLREEADRTDERAFVGAARRMLPVETYQAIWADVKAGLNEGRAA